MKNIPSVKGFRDFAPEDCALRNYLFEQWRTVARQAGFMEYEVPSCESTELYRRKSGAEILDQLFWFKDKNEREIALRPEITPSLARLACARQRDYRKPMKWFEIGTCFRYENVQRGRAREFYQFNVDILGETAPAADAELISVGLQLLVNLGFTPEDISLRVSDRRVWEVFMNQKSLEGDQRVDFLRVIDRMEKSSPDQIAKDLAKWGINEEEVKATMSHSEAADQYLGPVLDDLKARGLGDFIKIDLSIVRGLAYYTGLVFEFHDLKQGLRAIAGGGRYDSLCALIGGVDLPAAGFAMGDMVIGDLLQNTPHAMSRYTSWLSGYFALDAYLVLADETMRPQMLATLQNLRNLGWKVDASLTSAKPGKQFQAAETAQSRFAVVFGSEFPVLQVKDLAARQQVPLPVEALPDYLKANVPTPPGGPLLAHG